MAEDETDTERFFNGRITGPDGDGFVWLDWEDDEGMHHLNLGPVAEVSEMFADKLAEWDFGEG